MSNKSYFLNSKLIYTFKPFKPYKSYKSYKFILFLLLLIFVAIIFVDYNSLFNNFEGYCKYNSAKLEKDAERTGKKHQREHGKKTEKLGESKSWLGKMDNIPANI